MKESQGHQCECSDYKLSKASPYFTHMYAESSTEALPQMSTSLDITPFVFGGEDLRAYHDSSPPVEYKWVMEPSIPWDWNEDVRVKRLAPCLQTSSSYRHVLVVHVYTWKPKVYESKIATIFPNVMKLQPTPFHGMTSLLISNRAACVIHACKPSVVCSLEVGKDKNDTCPITISGKMKVWPEKVGELLASMYTFGTLNFLNELNDIPERVYWTTYGILAVRATGC